MAETIFSGIDRGGPAGIDFRHDRGQSERRAEEREQGEHRQVDLAGFDSVGFAHQPHLGVEHAVLITDSFGRTGRTAGEKDRRKIGGRTVCHFRLTIFDFRLAIGYLRLAIGYFRLPRQPPCDHGTGDGYPDLHAAERGPKDAANELGERDAEQDARPRARHAGKEVAQPHARIDDHRNGAEFEQRKCRGDQRQSLPDHDERPVPPSHAAGGEMRAPCIDLRIELGIGQCQVIDAARGGPAARDFHRGMPGLARGHQRQMTRDVGGVGGHAHQAPALGDGLHKVS